MYHEVHCIVCTCTESGSWKAFKIAYNPVFHVLKAIYRKPIHHIECREFCEENYIIIINIIPCSKKVHKAGS